MDKDRFKTRDKLKNISSIDELKALSDKIILTDEEREIFWMIYREGKPLDVVADLLGMSKSTVARKHSKILKKFGKIFT